MQLNMDDDDNETLKPIDESILGYYTQRPVMKWERDGISLETQQVFEIGFDLLTERITIPIRDDIGNLVGVKGRLYLNDDSDVLPKYMYLERCAKAQILFGLHKSLDFINQRGSVIVCESEKGVMQLWSQGYRNAVSIGGHTFSKAQVEKITRLNAEVIVAFDKDISENDILRECAKFIDCVTVSYIMDKDGVLDEKESPMDNRNSFRKLITSNKYSYVKG
jgi:DNA primase